MKKSITSFVFAMIISVASFAQISGYKYIGDGLDYQTVKDAIIALNAFGVGGEGGVTFMVPAGWTETFLSPADGTITTLTGSALNPIVFQKNGTGANPLITAGYGIGVTDAVFTIAGGDYITFDGINVKDNPLNTNFTTWMEWGYAILKASATDGSQNITIKNCSINLDPAYEGTIGIYSNNHLPGSTSQLVVTAASGSNSNLKIYSDTIKCNSGISLTGYADLVAPFSYYDQNNEIGKDGGNVIKKVAGMDGFTGYGIYTRSQNNLKVANNKITSAMGGSGSPYGICLVYAKNASYDLYNNYVSMQYTGGTGTTNFSPIYCTMGREGTSNIINIYNNTVTGCTNPNMKGAVANFMYLDSLGVTVNIYGNKVTNNVTGGGVGATATGNIYYLYARKVTTILGPFNMYNDTVSGNSRVQSALGSASTWFIANRGTSSTVDCYNNVVTNNVIGSSGSAYLLYSYGEGVKNIYGNTISNMTKADGTAYGIYNYPVISNSGTNYIYKNKVTNIEGNAAGSTIYGIYTLTGGVSAYFYNNMISDLRTTAATGTPAIYGMYISQGSYVGVYNNSVYLNATSSSATNFGTTAFYNGNGSTLLMDLRDNIFVNTSTAKGTGRTLAMRFSGAATTTFQSVSNNNIYYAGATAGLNYIFYDGTTYCQTLAAYKTLVFPRENQSATEMPPFANITSGSMDLHMKTVLATQCESGGTVISAPYAITADFENDPRYPNPGYPTNGINSPNAPDIGADEFGGVPNDLVGPAIIMTPLTNINHTNNRNLTITILDGSGIPSSGIGLPMLYWKTQSTAYQPVQATYISPGTYEFYFGGGVNIGDVISYYIVAQDKWSTPNLSASPATGVTAYTPNPPACSPPPTTPYTYTVMLNISGVFHVGLLKDYTTLTAAAADINLKWINGPVTLYLDDNTYPSETYPITFNNNPGSSAVNTLTIKPYTGATPAFNASITGAGTGVLKLNGIDYMIVDGTALGNNNTRDLTFQNTFSTEPVIQQYGVVFTNNGTDPPTNNTIKGCKIGCYVPSTISGMATTIYPVWFSTTGGPYDNTTFDNNFIRGGMFGIYAMFSATAPTSNLKVINNKIGSMTYSEYICSVGVNTQYCNYPVISNNELIGTAGGSTMWSMAGISIGGNVVGAKITRNLIHDYNRTDLPPYAQGGVNGIYYNSTDITAVTEISNNVIYNIKYYGFGSAPGQSYLCGIFLRSGGNMKIDYNSINMTGAFLSGANDAASACLGFYYQANGGNWEIRNNIFRNGMTGYQGNPPTGRAYGIMTSLPVTAFTNINNNDYWIDGYNGSIAQYWENGTSNFIYYPTLASWQAGLPGQELNSFNVDPMYFSDTYLLPTTTAMPHGGTYISSIPIDITGVNRTNPPDIGAYEFTKNNPEIITTGTSGITSTSATLEGYINSTTEDINLFFDWGVTTAYGNTVAATPASVPGLTMTTFTAGINGLTPATTYHFRARGVSATSGLVVYGSDLSFTATAVEKILNIKAFLEGLYAGGGVMNQAMDEFGPHFGPGIADQVTVELHNALNYSTIAYTSGLVNITTGGIVSITTLPVSLSSSYYITIKHRNSIETTTALPVSFAGNTINYDFTTSAVQAYGNNQKDEGGGRYTIWGADVNQDGIVDTGDMNPVENASTFVVQGYVAEDVNGDGIVDTSDMNYVENNSNAVIQVMTP